MEIVELELCANCKKEIPHTNYVMHTAHCARNITLCTICKEPVAKAQLESHKREFHVGNFGETLSSSQSARKAHQATSTAAATLTNGFSSHSNVSNVKTSKSLTNGVATRVDKAALEKKPPTETYKPKPKSDLIPCKFCGLELSKTELTDHENYCGSRTDKCMECGELVMFKYKKLHEETNHGFLKLNDEPGPRPTWDSSSQRSTATATTTARSSSSGSPFSHENYRPMALRTTSLLDTTLYSFPEEYRPPARPQNANAESYKQITRRLDCKTEYIRNLLHDSASITVPLRTNAVTPRNRFHHNKGPAPLPPPSSNPLSPSTSSSTTPSTPTTPKATARKPPTELCVPCDYCTLVLPHRDLVEHEAICGRSYLSTERAAASARRRRESPEPQAYGYDAADDDQYYSAYNTGGGRRDSGMVNGNGNGGGYNGGSAGRSTSYTTPTPPPPAPPSQFDFRPATVSSLLNPSGDYAPSRPSLVSTLNKTANSAAATTYASTNTSTCAGAAAAAAAAAASGSISPEVQLPCEFCSDMIPASQLLRHQATCF